MSVLLNPYLNFRGTAREAGEFYRSVLGGEIVSSTFRDYGMPVPEDELDHVMHSQLQSSAGFTLMISDVPSHLPYTPGTNLSVSLSGDDEAALRRWWAGLAEGATVTQPLEPAPWGGAFGMLTDRFGVQWLVNVNDEPSAES